MEMNELFKKQLEDNNLVTEETYTKLRRKNEYINTNPLYDFHGEMEKVFPGDFSFINNLRSPNDPNNVSDVIFSELHRELFIDIDDIILSNRMRFFSVMDDHLLFGIDFYS